MDDIDRELLGLLCTRIGMLMEDYSALALTVGSLPEGRQTAEVAALVGASTQIGKLAAAVQSIAD